MRLVHYDALHADGKGNSERMIKKTFAALSKKEQSFCDSYLEASLPSFIKGGFQILTQKATATQLNALSKYLPVPLSFLKKARAKATAMTREYNTLSDRSKKY